MKASLSSLSSLVASSVGDELLVEEFQRPYAWGEVQIEALFKDQFEPLLSGHSKLDNPFLGAIVLLPQKGGRTSVVDGQQRLLTLGLIIGYCSKVLASRRVAVPNCARHFLTNFRNSNWIHTEQYVNQDSLGAAMRSDLSLNETYSEFSASSKRLAASDGNKPSKRASVDQDLVPRAFGLIRSRIEDFVDSFESSSRSSGKGGSDAILSLLNHLTNKLQMVVVELVSHEQSLAVFEALNAAGQPLSLDQLVKCLVLKLFEKYDATIAKYLNQAWASKVVRGNISFTRKLKKTREREQFLVIYCNAFIDAASKRSAYRVLKRHFEALTKSKDPASECRRLIDDMQDYWCFLADCDFELFRFGGEVMIPTIFASRKALVKLGYSGARLEHALNEVVFLIESGFARAHFLKTSKSLLSSASFRLNPRILRARDLGEIKALISVFYHKLGGNLGSDASFAEAVAEHTFKGSSKVASLMLRRINVGLRTRFSSKSQTSLPVGAKYSLQIAKAYNNTISDKELVALGFKAGKGADRNGYQLLSQSIGNYLLLVQGQIPGKIAVNKPWTRSSKITKKFLEARRSWIARRAVMVWKI